MWSFGRVALVLLCGHALLIAQRTSASVTRVVSIPFVGCASFGQVIGREAPKGTRQFVRLREHDERALAFFQSADGIHIVAPRNWYCQGVSGSGGATLYLSPVPIVQSASGWSGLDGAAIQVDYFTDGHAGKFEIAEVIGRVLPAYRGFARRLWRGYDAPLPSSPYPQDVLRYWNDRVVEFRTPARATGLGNAHSQLGANHLPVVGAAVLRVEPPGERARISRLGLVSIRFPAELSRLAPSIIRYFEEDAELYCSELRGVFPCPSLEPIHEH